MTNSCTSYNLKKIHRSIATWLAVAQLLQASPAVMRKCSETSWKPWRLECTIKQCCLVLIILHKIIENGIIHHCDQYDGLELTTKRFPYVLFTNAWLFLQSWKYVEYLLYTIVEPPNKGHFGNNINYFIPYGEVVLFSEALNE